MRRRSGILVAMVLPRSLCAPVSDLTLSDRRWYPVWSGWAALGLIWGGPGAARGDEGVDFFESKIRPVLVESCYDCHSTDAKVKGGLLLDTKAGTLQGGDSGPALVPGDPAKSLLLTAIRHTDPDLEMPPKKKLSDAQIADFETWIRLGAPDPRTGDKPVTKLDEHFNTAKTHWAFQPVTKPAVPGDGHPVDAFVREKLAAAGLTPSPLADARTLIRRLSFDLIGLPPAPEEVEAYAAAHAADPARAWDQAIERLLASPHYGERWGRHWLDVARYADNMGSIYNGDDSYPYAFTYRDYVIRAFNEDRPYDVFLREQIAADLLPDPDPEDNSRLAALGFLNLGRRYDRKVDDNHLDDRIDLISRGLQGLTASCARCHDHKLEPIPTKDYYALYGIFKSSAEPEVYPALKPQPESPEGAAYLAENRKARSAYAAASITAAGAGSSEARQRVGDYLMTAQEAEWKTHYDHKPIMDTILKRKLQGDLHNATARARKTWVEAHPEVFGPFLEFITRTKLDPAPALHPLVAKTFATPATTLEEFAKRYNELFAGIDREWRALAAEPLKQAAALRETDLDPPLAKLAIQAIARIDEVETALPLPDAAREQLRQVLIAKDSPVKIAPDRYATARLFPEPEKKEMEKLAKPLTDLAQHPGAPIRVMALEDTKPYDAKIFLRGDPRTPGDAAPRAFFTLLTRPDAAPFPADSSGRLQLADAIVDPRNPLTARVIVNRVWQWHFGEGLVRTPSDFGLRGEAPTHPELLDWLATYFVESGWSFKALHRLILGSETWRQQSRPRPELTAADPDNRLWARAQPRPLEFEPFRDALLAVSGGLDLSLGGKPADLIKADSPRRTVYAAVDRKTLPNLFRSFDFPDPNFSAAGRGRTALTPQALYLMNSATVVDRARALAQAARPESPAENEAGIRDLYRRVFQRAPGEAELDRALDFVTAYPEDDVVMPEVSDWAYGYGDFNADTGRIEGFTPLKFAGNVVKGGKVGDADLTGLEISATGGQPAAPAAGKVAVRRWIAPQDGKVNLYAELLHQSAEGDGVVCHLLSSRQGRLGEWSAANRSILTTLNDIEVKKGETLDFATVCRTDPKGDTYQWAPTLTMTTAEMPGMAGLAMRWDARTNFLDPARMPQPLGPWEELAQVLLLSNEFIWVE
jgi:mono/diheme cytochrome c family protein